MPLQGRNILFFVDICAAYRQDTVISKLEKLVYYPAQFKSMTPFMRTGHALDTEENIFKLSHSCCVYINWIKI